MCEKNDINFQMKAGLKTRMGTILAGMFPSTLVHLAVFLGARLRLLKLAAPSGFFNHFLQPRAFL